MTFSEIHQAVVLGTDNQYPDRLPKLYHLDTWAYRQI